MKDKLIKRWIKERNKACQSFDVEKFKAFYIKWAERGLYDLKRLPPDDILEISLRKMVVNLANPDPQKYEEARAWLLSRGYDLKIGGDK